MNKKIRIGLLFGGRSAEHEVSLMTARNVYEALDKNKYEVVLIGIDKKGKWYFDLTTESLLNSPKPVVSSEARNLVLHSDKNKDFSVTSFLRNDKEGFGQHLDVVFPLLHGPYGEDGTVQGLLKLANIPFVGASVLGSAIGMDKDIMKRLLRDAGIPVAKFLVLRNSNNNVILASEASPKAGEARPESSKKRSWTPIQSGWTGQDDDLFRYIKNQLGLPFFVKPANMGSSVGVSKVHDEAEFDNSLSQAFQFDTKVIIEEAIDAREIECSVLGNENPKASVAGEVIPTHEFYDYDAKYIDENGAHLVVPADISNELLQQVQELAVRVFKTLCCEGMARVDFFLTKDKKLLVNEINTIPGFTNISMYPKLWEASGIGYSELIDQLIQLALDRHKRDASLQSTRY